MSGITFDALPARIAFDDVHAQLEVRALLLDAALVGGGLVGGIQLGGSLLGTARMPASLQAAFRAGALLIEPAGDYLTAVLPGLGGRMVQADPTPAYTMLVGVVGGMGFSGSGSLGYANELSAPIGSVRGLLIEPEGDYLLAQGQGVGALIREVLPPINNYAIAAQSAGYVWSYGAFEVAQVSDAIRFGDSLASQVALVLADQLRFGAGASTRLDAMQSLSDRMRLAEVLRFGFRIVLADGFRLSEGLTFSAGAVEELVDYLLFSEVVDSRAAALAVVASALALGDLAVTGDAVVMEDELLLGEALSERLHAAAVAVDALLLGEALEHSAGFTVLVGDALALGDAVASTAALIEALRDGFRVIGRLRLGDEEFVGYVCNTANRAFSTYANFPFNSMAKIGSRYYGAADDGLYLLEGEDDGGAPIRARARLAVTNLGTGKQKRMPSAYIGYQGGRVVLKTITTSATGEKEEHWYAIEPRPAVATRESRIPIGRGLKSVYWGFEIEAVEPFELDSLQLFPMILERRL